MLTQWGKHSTGWEISVHFMVQFDFDEPHSACGCGEGGSGWA
jgi:hypothetical protein